MSTAASPALADVLRHAADAWQLFRAGRSLDRAIAAAVASRPELRPAVQDVTYHAVRRLAASERIIEQLTAMPPAADVAALLAVSLGQLHDGRHADYTVVDQAVSAAQSSPKMKRAAGFVNAVLRNFLRQRERLSAELLRDESIRCNLPQWWIDRLRHAYADDWLRVAEAQQQMPPLILRVNIDRVTVDDYLHRLQALAIDAIAVGAQAVWMRQPRPVVQIPGFVEGEVSVQDAGAQLAASWLDARPAMRVLDACAAPGGKTAHLAELGVTDLTALDVDAVRAARIEENLRRIGGNAHIVIGDAAHPEQWASKGGKFDRILLDAPCTASGIVRRHPDIPWLRRPDDVAQLTTVQGKLLGALWPLLNAGGRLLYVVCSLFPEEGREQIARFVRQHSGARQLPLPATQLLPTSAVAVDAPWHGAALPTLHDGFFYALLEKTG